MAVLLSDCRSSSVADFRLDPAEVKALLSAPNGMVAQDMRRRGNAVLRQAKRLAPKDTGTLSRSIVMEMAMSGGKPVVYVGSSLKYAVYVHEGTGLWSKRGGGYIVPVRKKALRWPRKNNSGGGSRRYKAGATSAYTFAKRSKGSRPRPFLTDALPEAYK